MCKSRSGIFAEVGKVFLDGLSAIVQVFLLVCFVFVIPAIWENGHFSFDRRFTGGLPNYL